MKKRMQKKEAKGYIIQTLCRSRIQWFWFQERMDQVMTQKYLKYIKSPPHVYALLFDRAVHFCTMIIYFETTVVSSYLLSVSSIHHF